MNPYYELLESRGFVPPSPFETIVRLLCAVASAAAVCWAGAWTALWTLPIMLLLNAVSEGVKRIYWKGFDPYIRRGAERGDFLWPLFWNILTVTLDWALSCLPGVTCAYLLDALVGTKPISPLFKWLFFWVCMCPPFMYPLRKGELDVRLYPLVLRTLPGFPVALAFFMPVSANWVLLFFALVAIPTVGISVYLRLPSWKKDFDKWYDEAKASVASVPQKNARCWFPREGVLFEPQFSPTFNNSLDSATRETIRKTFMILRINWCGFVLSLVMFLSGAVLACRCASSIWLLLVPPCALFGLFVGLCLSDIDRKRAREEHEGRFAILLMLSVFAGLMTLWLGGHDMMRLLAAGLLATSSFMFFTGFLVRGSSEGVSDTLDFLCLAAGIALVIVCRLSNVCLWWESLLPLLLTSGLPGFLRIRWPRRDLPFVPKTEPPLLTLAQEKKARRERKRERQVAALRRSQRRG